MRKLNVGEVSVFSHIQFIHHNKDRTRLYLVENPPDIKTEDAHHEEQQPAGKPDRENGRGIAANLVKFEEIGNDIDIVFF